MSCSTQQCRVRRLLPFALPPESELRSAMRSASATTSELQEGRSEWWSTSVVEVHATKCKCEMVFILIVPANSLARFMHVALEPPYYRTRAIRACVE